MNLERQSLRNLVDLLPISEVKKVLRYTETLLEKQSTDHNAVPTMGLIRAHRHEILEAAERNKVHRVEVFGSVANAVADEFSDIDLLVDFDVGASLLDLIGFKQDVEDLLGTAVDVVSRKALEGNIKDRILKEAIPL